MAIDDPTPAGDATPSTDMAPARRPGLPPMPSVHGDAPTVGFLELFYDLVFVASTMVLSNAFSERLTWHWAGVCSIVFALVWLLWFHTTLLMNVERRDDFGHRTLVLVQMFLIAMTTLAFVDRNYAATDYLGGTYGAAVIVVGLMYHRVHKRSDDVAEWARLRRNRLLIAGGLMLINSFTDDWVDNIVFVVAIVILVTPTRFGPVKRAPLPRVDIHHLTERAALLTLIMCGEAFVKVSLVVSGAARPRRRHRHRGRVRGGVRPLLDLLRRRPPGPGEARDGHRRAVDARPPARCSSASWRWPSACRSSSRSRTTCTTRRSSSSRSPSP